MNKEDEIKALREQLEEIKQRIDFLEQQPEDKNAFVKRYDNAKHKYLSAFSEEAFGYDDALEVATGGCTDNLKHLIGKSLWVCNRYKVIIHESGFGTTVIEIQKK